jgi:nicotinamide riboside kinase
MLCNYLAAWYKGESVPEYAREYVSRLDHPYTYTDVVHIAEKQLELMNEYSQHKCNYLFVDTYLIITKVWLMHVYQKKPGWIDQEISKTKDALYLLCKPDIPWEPDGIRENGGIMRSILFNRYLHELKLAGLRYAFVEGAGLERVNNAIHCIQTYL